MPKVLKNWIDKQVERGGYGTASEFVRELVREKRDAELARSEIDNALLEGLEGPFTPMTDADWQRIRRDGLKRVRQARSRK
jgi:antitoxin ParD1/3/4